MLATQEIQNILAQEIDSLLDRQMDLATNLALGWHNHIDDMRNWAYGKMYRGKPQTAKESEQRIIMIKRANALIGTILVHVLNEVGKDVSAQIEQEFPTAIGKQFADELRTTDPDNHWIR